MNSATSYKVSVVTPFHNVDMDMFQEAYQSMLNQTIGFENIEWIIVVHNCKPHCMPELQQLLGHHQNVLLKELNNDAKTPSSPRNYGVALATAPYIGYLDGDDSFTLSCLEVCCREMKETGAQVLKYRREYELEHSGLNPVSEVMAWNQTSSRIVMNRETKDYSKMFIGSFGFVTSQIFDRQFLLENEITFDETVPFAEDFLYTMHCLSKADSVCYLPQFIGYHYYINSHSLVQGGSKTGETLIAYAQGYKKIFDTGYAYGIDMQSGVLQGLCWTLSVFILGSPKISVEDRKTIRGLLKPYIDSFRPLTPSKINPPAACESFFNLPKAVILNPEDPFHNPYVVDTSDGLYELNDILAKNIPTDFGQAYKFDQVKGLREYQESVPLSDYENYEKLIALQTNVGETDILVKESINRYFLLPNGKLLPNTASHFRPYNDAFASILNGRHNLLIASSKPVQRITNDGAEIDTLESMLVKDYFRSSLYFRGKKRAEFSAPISSFYLQQEEPDYQEVMYHALADRDIDQIVAINTVEVMNAFRALENTWKSMLERLIKEGLAERAIEVASILFQGFDKPVAKALWPKLERVVAFGAGELYESCREMKRYTGDVPHNHGFYYTEEAILGKAVADDSELLECFQGQNFYELLPITIDLEKEEENVPLKWSEAETGKPYQLVVTNRAGLYRYKTEHIVCLQEIDFHKVKFTIY